MQSDGTPLPPKRRYVPCYVLRVEQRWPPAGEGGPPKSHVLAAGEKFRNVEKLNAETPKSEWCNGPDGKPKGPYENVLVVYLVDPTTWERATFVASTVGARRAVRDLCRQVELARKFRVSRVYAVVELADTHMPTQYGGRQRPHFVIVGWWKFGDEGEGLLPAPSPEVLPAADAAPPREQARPDGGARTDKSKSSSKDLE